MKNKKVSNPLTMIAIFCGLAEVSGTIVLPLLDPYLQDRFLWFVIFFPFFVSMVFFFILYTKHKVLYSPSDFSNDKYFIELINDLSEISDIAREHVSDEVKDKINNIKEDIIHKTRNHILNDDESTIEVDKSKIKKTDESLEKILELVNNQNKKEKE